jgi:hypothetical protein
MGSASITEQVRHLVNDVFLTEFGVPKGQKIRETMLIRNGNYCGHKFQLGPFQAVWFIEEDELKFSGEKRQTVRTMTVSAMLSAESEQSRAA